jgi:hypothetical protein
MRGDILYQIFGVHAAREKDVFLGAFRTTEEALAEIKQLKLKEMNQRNWAEQYHNKGFVVSPKVVATDFEIPPLPKLREKYFVSSTAKSNRPGTWDSAHVEVFRRGLSIGDNQRICQYDRNYAMLQTFEPFRQGNREFALMSRDYTRTAVLDLASGEVIAEESRGGERGPGFCPVGFFVPDWWDLNDDSALPGNENWSADGEWPTGDFGFVWGCIWGDDSSWKVQHLDLSRVRDGVINRDARFGYIELAIADYVTPCLTTDPDAAKKIRSPSFIKVSRYKGVSTVTFAVEMGFDLQSGKSDEWQRLKVENLE